MPRNSRTFVYFCFTHLLLALLLVSVTSSCERQKVYKIGVSQCSSDDWRTKMNDEILREAMFHEDASVEIRSADDNNIRQINDIRYFAENGFDIIIVAPNEAAALTPVIREVYNSGIPVIIFDRNIIGDSYTARIGVDDVGLGRAAARYASRVLGTHSEAIEIFGLPGSTPAEDRHRGFADEYTAAGGRIAASLPGNWNRDDAAGAIDSVLRSHPGIDLIFAHNDRMAIGASEVARKLGRDDIRIIGIDAAPSIGIKAVTDSVIDATFLYPTEGHRLLRTALAILKGEKYDRETILPVSSAVDLSNADVLLLQDDALKEETGKMRVLKNRIDDYWARHSSQTMLFYASIAIIILLTGVVFLTFRAYWQHQRHRRTLIEQNRLLETERDKQARLNEQLREATASKLRFFTNVSHDLRTPLTLIAEPVAQLHDAPNLTLQQAFLVRLADKNLRILRRLINQILDFRKIENGKLELSLSEIDLGKALSDWMEAFHALARKRDMKLSLSGPRTPVKLAADAEKLERIVFNLLSNAFKYTPDNGTITVTYGISGNNAVIHVTDSGQGISECDLGNIFDRFYQVDRVHPDGSGIGLSLTKAFVELHGGTISAESTLGKGSDFTVTLPVRHISENTVPETPRLSTGDVAAELEDAADDNDSPQEFADDKPLVLVIDDNRDMQRLVCTILSETCNVITASNGSEGLRRGARYTPDLIICDVMMPVMDGLECCRRLKNEVSTSHIPVLMLTACSLDEQRIQGYDSGADGYLSKPFSGQMLRSRCASLIANRKRIKDLWQNTDDASARLAPAAPKKPEQRSPSVPDIDNEFYQRFLTLFRSEMSNPDTNVDSLASKMGLERSQFYRKIKALTNYSPVELIRSLRLKQGRTLLISTDKSISEIAYETGFSTPAYFTKCFRDAFGETPSELRSRLGNA